MSRKSRQADAAAAKAAADAYRQKTDAAVEMALRPNVLGQKDYDFARGYANQRQGEQDYLDRQARDAAAKAKGRWGRG